MLKPEPGTALKTGRCLDSAGLSFSRTSCPPPFLPQVKPSVVSGKSSSGSTQGAETISLAAPGPEEMPPSHQAVHGDVAEPGQHVPSGWMPHAGWPHRIQDATDFEGDPHTDLTLQSGGLLSQVSETEGESTSDEPSAPDPELGILRLRELPYGFDPESELGTLRLRAAEGEAETRPFLYLQGRTGFFYSNNIFSSDLDPIEDGLFRVGVSLYAVPAIGPRTYLTALVGGELLRYARETDVNYNELRLSLGGYHALTRRTYLDVRWVNQQLFNEDDDDRFLNDHQFRLAVGRRDRLSSDLVLNTAYQARFSLADPETRSRIFNIFNVSLSYEFKPRFRSDLLYQFALVDFTEQDRNDRYHQLLAQVTYQISRRVYISVYGGGRLGNSSDSSIDFDSGLFGINLGVNLPLF